MKEIEMGREVCDSIIKLLSGWMASGFIADAKYLPHIKDGSEQLLKDLQSWKDGKVSLTTTMSKVAFISLVECAEHFAKEDEDEE